jgi:hypothetical protein
MQALIDQATRVTLTSRAFRNDQLPLLCKLLHDLTGYDLSLPMNSGAEAVETAIKAARKWGYTVKGIPGDQAEIIVCAGNFHGRTTTIVSFSTDAQYRDGYGPMTPGFRVVPFGDAAALEAAISPNTAAFLVEPTKLCFKLIRFPRPSHQIIIRLYTGTERHPLPHETGIFFRSSFRCFERDQLLIDPIDRTDKFRRNNLDTGRERPRQEESPGEGGQTVSH